MEAQAAAQAAAAAKAGREWAAALAGLTSEVGALRGALRSEGGGGAPVSGRKQVRGGSGRPSATWR